MWRIPKYMANNHPWGIKMPLAKFDKDLLEMQEKFRAKGKKLYFGFVYLEKA